LDEGSSGKSCHKILATGQISGQNGNETKGEMAGREYRKHKAIPVGPIPAFDEFSLLRDGLQTPGDD
jgi:hypothetical protein